MAPLKPYVPEPVQPADVEQNFHHLKMGLDLLLQKRPSDVRSWLLTTRHAKTACMRPPAFGLLNHLDHPSVLPLLGGLLFGSFEGLASHAAALEAAASHGFIESIWDGIWKESRGEAWFDLLVFLLEEGGPMFEAGGLFRFLGSSEYSADIVKVFNQSSPTLCRFMVDFIDRLDAFSFILPNHDRPLSLITHDILQTNLDSICTAFAALASTASQAKFLATLVRPIRAACQHHDLSTHGCSFSPLLFKASFDLVFAKEKSSIIHCSFLSLVDSLVGCILNQPEPISAVQSATYLLLEMRAASKAMDGYNAKPPPDQALMLTLYLFRLALNALYLAIEDRSDPVVTPLKLTIRASPDFNLVKSLPPPRDPPLHLENLPVYLSFTRGILTSSKITCSNPFLDGLYTTS